MNVPFVDLHAQYTDIKPAIDGAIENILANTAFVGGPIVRNFEQAFAQAIGVKHCIGCGNGTDSLEIIFKALGLGPGHEVLVPANSWISTSETVSNMGARPVFVDVLPGEYNFDPADAARKITGNTKAIVPVHLYGLPARLGPIMDLAEKHGLTVVEDAAQAHLSAYQGHTTGTIGHVASYSFYPGKNLGAYGDAGGMVTNDDALAERLRMIANHGQQGKHNHVIEGRNSRLDTLQAAILHAKLPHLPQWTERRIAHAAKYTQLLAGTNVVTPTVPEGHKHVYHLYVVAINNRDKVKEQLKARGIATQIHYPTPLPFLPAYASYGHSRADFPVSAEAQHRILSLPMYAELTEQQIEYVCHNLIELTS